MGLRPGRCYRKLERPYTRQSKTKPRKSYAKGVPESKIKSFEAGTKKPFSKTLVLISERGVQIRHNALEAARIVVTKKLEAEVGLENFFFKVLVYPHHILRENPLATGAGADRFQTGMRLSYGKAIGTAARVHPGQKLIEVRTEQNWLLQAKHILKSAASKLPTPCKIVEVTQTN